MSFKSQYPNISKNKRQFIVLILIVAISFQLVPAPASALLGVSVQDVTHIAGTLGQMAKDIASWASEWARQNWEKLYREGLGAAFKSALGIFLNQLAHDTAVWIASGGEGQEALIFTEGWGPYLLRIGDAALGEFVYEAGKFLEETFTDVDAQLNTYLTPEKRQELAEFSDVIINLCDSRGGTNQERVECRNEGIRQATRDAVFESLIQEPRNLERYDQCVHNAYLESAEVTIEEAEDRCKDSILPTSVRSPLTHDVLSGLAADLAANICAPSLPEVGLRISLGLKKELQRPRCTFSQMRRNWEQEVRSPNFAQNFLTYFQDNSNDIGIALTLWDKQLEDEANKQLAAFAERLAGRDIKAQKDKVGGTIKTPGIIVHDLFDAATKNLSEKEKEWTGTLADAIAMFVNTLAGTFLDRVGRKGLVQPSNVSRETFGSPFSSSEVLTSYTSSPGAAGIAGAELRFADFKKIDFSGGGAFSIVNKLATCSDPDNPGPTECVITENFRDVIIAGQTVKEAIENGNLDGDLPLGFTADGLEPPYNEGYPYRSLLILRKYRIIPVGWELAALYIKHFGDDAVSLKTIMFNFDNPRSPFYRLIDPNWVLKSPENFCAIKGPGPEIITEQILKGIDLNNDGDFKDSGDIPPEILLNRDVEYCADEKSCLATNEDGSCKFFGYCTQDRPIWNFQGEECDAVFNTCQAFQDTRGATVAYLKNTLEFDGCSADNAGCQWYCEDRSPTNGDWACTEKLGRKKYFDRDAELCSQGAAGCHHYFSLQENQGANLILNSSLEDFDGIIDDGAGDNFLTKNSAIVNHEAASEAFLGNVAALLTMNTDFNISVDTGMSVRGRTFIFSFYAKGCSDNATFGFIDPGASPGNISNNVEWARFSVVFRYPEARPQTNIDVFVKDSTGTNCKIDALFLEEGDTLSPHRDYQNNPAAFLKTAPDNFNCTTANPDLPLLCDDYSLSCTQAEVGCALYTPIRGVRQSLPAVTREADFCPAECVGYATFKQKATFLENSEFPVYFIPDTAISCSASQAGCDEFTNLDKVALGGEAREYYSYIRQCVKPGTLACATYFSWVGTEETGYQLITHSLRQDVGDGDGDGDTTEPFMVGTPALIADIDLGVCNDADDAINNPECRQYFDSSGRVTYQFWRHTVSCTDNCIPFRKTDSNLNDCSDSGGNWQAAESYCLYNAVPEEGVQCSANTAGCRAYAGNAASNIRDVFFDDFEDGAVDGWDFQPAAAGGGISTESINPAGHSLFAPQSSRLLAPVVKDNFIKGHMYEISFWARATTTLTALVIVAPDGNTVPWLAPGTPNAFIMNPPAVKDYVIISTQWNRYTFGPFVYDPTGLMEDNIFIGFGGFLPGDAQTRVGALQEFFLDNIRITEVQDNIYRIKDSWVTPLSCDNLVNDPFGSACVPPVVPPATSPACEGTFESPCRCSGPDVPVGIPIVPSITPYALGCKTYNGPDGEVHLKSFTSLCRDDAVGCEVLIDTENSTTPYDYIHNAICDTGGGAGDCTMAGFTDPVCTADASGRCYFNLIHTASTGAFNIDGNTVIVPSDNLVYVVNNPQKSCLVNDVGCTGFGNPNQSSTLKPNVRITQDGNEYFAGVFFDNRRSLEVYNYNPPPQTHRIGVLNGLSVEGAGESNMLVYQDTGTDVTSLFVLHDAYQTDYPGRVAFDFTGVSPIASLNISDDSGASPEMTLDPVAGIGAGDWTYNTDSGDGAVIDFSQNRNWNITVNPTSWTKYCTAEGHVRSDTACVDNTDCGVGVTTKNYCLLEPYRECIAGSLCDGNPSNPCTGGMLAPLCRGIDEWSFLSSNGQRVALDMSGGPVTIEYSVAGFVDEGFLYTTDYLLDRPDDYETILCLAEEAWCEEYTSEEGSVFFKNPRENVCEWRLPSNELTGAMWLKKKKTSAGPNIPCLVYEGKTLGKDGVAVSAPAGECRSGVRDGTRCLSDVDCPGGYCALFAGSCPITQSSCMEYIDPLSNFNVNLLFNGNFEQDVDTDNIPDGWNVSPVAPPNGLIQYDNSRAVKTVINDVTVAPASAQTLYQYVTLEPDTLYAISADIKRGESGGVFEENPAALVISECVSILLNQQAGDLGSPDGSMTPSIDSDCSGVPADTIERWISVDNFDNISFKTFSGRFKTGKNRLYSIFVGAIEEGADSATIGHWFDNVSIRKTGIYYNLANTLDKTSCNGVVEPDSGCVLFNERDIVGDNLEFSTLIFDADQSGLDRFKTASTVCDNTPYNTLCDGNKLVKVRPDRQCAEWLTCRSSIQEVTLAGEVKDQCLDLGLCVAIDEETGACSRTVPRTASPSNVTLNDFITNEYPIDLASYLTGYTKAGSVYQKDGLIAGEVEGFMSFDQMLQTGDIVSMENGSFELYSPEGQPIGWHYEPVSAVTDMSWSPDKFMAIGDPGTAQDELGVVHRLAPEGRAFLRVGSVFNATSEIFDVSAGNDYIISAFINTSNLESGNADIRIEEYDADGNRSADSPFLPPGATALTFGDSAEDVDLLFLSAGVSWKFKVAHFKTSGVTTKIKIRLVSSAGDAAVGSFYYDKIQIMPALRVQTGLDPTDNIANTYCFTATASGSSECYIPQGCRLFPEDDALSCRYLDESGLLVDGWPGYCLERDPKNTSICLEWWPVDKIIGDALDEVGVGYLDRTPLYMCLQAGYNLKTYSFDGVGAQAWACIHDRCNSNPFTMPEVYNPPIGIAAGILDPDDILSVVADAFGEGTFLDDLLTRVDSGAAQGFCFLKDDSTRGGVGPCTSPDGNPGGGCCKGEDYNAPARVFDRPCNTASDCIGSGQAGEQCTAVWNYIRSTSHSREHTLLYDVDSKIWWYEFYGQDSSNDCDDRWRSGTVTVTWQRPVDFFCSDIAQVVTPSGNNLAWLGRVSPGSSYVVPGGGPGKLSTPALNYTLSSDYQPFGGAVPPDPVGFPGSWDGRESVCVNSNYDFILSNTLCNSDARCTDPSYSRCAFIGRDPLPIESPDYSGFSSPYQVRGGSPYSCPYGSSCQIGLCLETLDICTADLDCALNVCCIAANGDFSAGGRCAQEPFPLSFETSTVVPRAVEQIQRIFARSYGTWLWDSVGKSYVPAGNDWLPPSTPCNANIRPPYAAGSNSDLCGVAPVIGDIRVSTLQSAQQYVDNTGFISLTFTTIIDFNQLPVRRIKIDWGDGQTSVVSGIRMRDRQNPEDPHKFFHLYSYWDLKGREAGEDAISCGSGIASATGEPYNYCNVDIRMQVKDNWSWCNGTDPAPILGYFGSLCDTLNLRTPPYAWTAPVTLEVRE